MRLWHIYVVGLIALIWNGFGAFDYVMTQTQNEAYLSAFTEEERAYFQSFPAWVQGCWAVAVWFSVLGSLFILLRNPFAPVTFAIAFVAMVATTVHNFLLADVTLPQMMGAEAYYVAAAIFVSTGLLWLYARWLRQRGYLG